MRDILEKFKMKNFNFVDTPMETGLKLVKDFEGKKVGNTFYKQIVGSLMYLTTTRPDIMHVVNLISIYGVPRRDESSSYQENFLIHIGNH